MSLSILAKKLNIKEDQRILLVNAPESYTHLLDPLPQGTILFFNINGVFDHIHLFVRDSEELDKELKAIHRSLQDNTVFWIAYPKKSSGVKSDLDMMSSWKEPEKYGLRPVASVAVDEKWTALRFRPASQVKKSGVANSEIPNNELGKYIDIKNRIIILPPDLKAELEFWPSALAFFESLAWSHKKEYISWILSAKQEKTRISRIKKAAEMLASNKKNPAAK